MPEKKQGSRKKNLSLSLAERRESQGGQGVERTEWGRSQDPTKLQEESWEEIHRRIWSADLQVTGEASCFDYKIYCLASSRISVHTWWPLFFLFLVFCFSPSETLSMLFSSDIFSFPKKMFLTLILVSFQILKCSSTESIFDNRFSRDQIMLVL